MSKEIYISTDVETDGPIPGPHSMLSFASAAFYPDDTRLVSTFEANLEVLPDALGHPDTMEWWSTQPKAWSACRENLEPPAQAMERYVAWLNNFADKPVFVAYPAGFDFMFVYWYLIRFTGKSPFSFSALDLKTFAWCLLGGEYRRASKRNMPKHWLSKHPHTHKALDDAIEQGEMFINMLKDHKARIN